MYLETMEKVLADIDKIIIDKNSGSGVVPYLPLPELKKRQLTNEKIYNTNNNFSGSNNLLLSIHC